MKHLYLLPLLLLAPLSGHAQRTRQDFVVKTNGDTLRGEFRKGFCRLPDRFSLDYVAGAGVLIRRRTGPSLNLEFASTKSWTLPPDYTTRPRTRACAWMWGSFSE